MQVEKQPDTILPNFWHKFSQRQMFTASLASLHHTVPIQILLLIFATLQRTQNKYNGTLT